MQIGGCGYDGRVYLHGYVWVPAVNQRSPASVLSDEPST